MERKVNFADWQKMTQEDADNLGTFPRESFDDLVSNVLIPDKCYSGFGVTETGVSEVTVAEGRLLYDGKMFLNDTSGGTVVNLLSLMPTATQKYVAITTWGQEIDTETEPRTYLTDATTRATIAKAVSTESRRWANISTVAGAESPDPDYPSIADNVCAVAYVLLDTSGIVEITMNTTMACPTLREADNRLNAFDAWKIAVGTAIETLRSDLAGLAAKLFGTARQAFVLDLARDLARTKEALNLPDSYLAWGSDHYLNNDESDTQHVDWLAVCEEGCRFPNAAYGDSQIGLQNQYDPNANQQNFFVLPAYDETARITVSGNDSQQNISTYQYQTITYALKSVARTRWRFGPWFETCTNYIFYSEPWANQGTYWIDRVQGIFSWQGDTWQIDPSYLDIQNHVMLRIRQVWVDTWNDYYLQEVRTTTQVAGSLLAQSFLNSQDGWVTSFDLYFTAVAATGDVKVLLCETTNGAPDYNKVIRVATIAHDDLHIYPTATNVPFIPTFLAAGKRYSLVLSTPSAMYVSLVEGNKYAQGSLFYSTDAAWFMADLTKDLAFTAYFAKFRSPRVELQLNSLTLTDGIAGIDLLTEAVRPPQTEISWEVQDDSSKWVSLNMIGNYETNPIDPFTGLPALLPFRAVLLGTVDSMPGFGVSSHSRVITRRPRSDFTHISTERTTQSNANTVYVTCRCEAWRGDPYHQFVVRLLWGDGQTVENYDTLVQYEAPDDPNAEIFEFTFSGLTPDNNYRIRMEGDTNNVLTCFHVAERVDVAVSL